jgi:hypothetical protein
MQEITFSLQHRSAALDELVSKALAYAEAGQSPATRRAEASDWRDFEAWCRERNLESLPATPEAVGLYLSDKASALAVSTLERRLISITQAHRNARVAGMSPASTRQAVVGAVMRGIRRIKGVAPRNRKAPLLNAEIRKLITVCAGDNSLRGSGTGH